MPEYVQVDQDSEFSPPPYMDPANAKKKSIVQAKKSMAAAPGSDKKCDHCGHFPPQHEHELIWPAPRPVNHIRPDNKTFIGYVLLIAIVIFLLFAACKYLP